MQRHRNHQHFTGRLCGQWGDGKGQHPAQTASRGMQSVVFERMNRRSHAVLIRAISNGADKSGRSQSTSPAKLRARYEFGLREVQFVAATDTREESARRAERFP